MEDGERSRWQAAGLCDPRVVQARDLLEKALVVADPLVHLDATIREAGREDVLVHLTEERHRADLGETGLDVHDRLKLRGGAEDGGGVAIADVLWVEGEVAVRGAGQRGGRTRERVPLQPFLGLLGGLEGGWTRSRREARQFCLRRAGRLYFG